MMDIWGFKREDEQKSYEMKKMFEGYKIKVMGTVKVDRFLVPVGHRAHHIVFHFDFDGV